MKNLEILAPVGKFDMLEAGLAAGADSFYMSLDDFGARAYAENFNLDNIGEIIDYVHLFGKKVFITINTLIKDEEMDKALYYIEKLYEKGADALLIQDIGLFSLIKDKVPGLELHASTQMAIRDYYGAKAAHELGFDRVVIARETPFAEIEKIVTLPVDTEVFVHGSLCVSFSGECLMSSFLGKRSANRGRCAGICRKKYQLISDGKVLDTDYYLSMNDLKTIDQVEKLVDIGVDSLKIEGRMKTPEYAYTIVKSYRDKLDRGVYDSDDLVDISNRAFTQGFIFGQKRDYINLEDAKKRRPVGQVQSQKSRKFFLANSDLDRGSILEVTTDKNKKLPLTLTQGYEKGDKIYLDHYPDAKEESDVLMVSSPRLKDHLDQGLASYKSLPLDIEFTAKVGQRPKIELNYQDTKVTYQGDEILERAKNISIGQRDIEENLAKLNDTVFVPKSIKVTMDPDVFIRKKQINQARRQGVARLEKALASKSHRKPIKIEKRKLGPRVKRIREHNIELLDNKVSPQRLRFYDNIYIREYDEKFEGLSLYYVLDAHQDYDIDELIKFLKEKSIKGVVFNNYRDLAFVEDFKKNGIRIRIGRYLNVFNSYAFDFYKDFAEMISASVETTFYTINQISKAYPVEIVDFGQIELMTMVHCPFSAYKKCGLVGCPSCKFRRGKLKDDQGHVFDVRRYDGYSKIYATDYAQVDQNKLSDQVSLLSLISSDEDLDRLEKREETNNLNYERGVL